MNPKQITVIWLHISVTYQPVWPPPLLSSMRAPSLSRLGYDDFLFKQLLCVRMMMIILSSIACLDISNINNMLSARAIAQVKWISRVQFRTENSSSSVAAGTDLNVKSWGWIWCFQIFFFTVEH